MIYECAHCVHGTRGPFLMYLIEYTQFAGNKITLQAYNGEHTTGIATTATATGKRITTHHSPSNERAENEWHTENVPNRLSVEWVCASCLKCIIDEIVMCARKTLSILCDASVLVANKIELDGCNLFSIPKLTLPSWAGVILKKMQFAGSFISFFIYLVLFSFCTDHFSNFKWNCFDVERIEKSGSGGQLMRLMQQQQQLHLHVMHVLAHFGQLKLHFQHRPTHFSSITTIKQNQSGAAKATSTTTTSEHLTHELWHT